VTSILKGAWAELEGNDVKNRLTVRCVTLCKCIRTEKSAIERCFARAVA
jgi:hypothetical protein